MVSKAARAGTPGTQKTRRQHLGLLPVGYRFRPGRWRHNLTLSAGDHIGERSARGRFICGNAE